MNILKYYAINAHVFGHASYGSLPETSACLVLCSSGINSIMCLERGVVTLQVFVEFGAMQYAL